MKIIGVTGGIASGKSSVTNFLRLAGHPVVCADELARNAVAPDSEGLKKVIAVFGRDFLTPDGSLDRKKLAETVFKNEVQRRQLESIIHPQVRRLMKQTIADEKNKGTSLLFLDIPLLFESNLDTLCDETVCVYTTQELQISRHMARSGDSREHTLDRLASQLPLDHKIHLADHVIHNTETLADLETQTQALLKQLLSNSADND